MKHTILTQVIIYSFLSSVGFSWDWEQTGPDGGYFRDFLIHPNNSQIIFAGSDDSGGLWKSLDGGTSWELKTADWPDMTAWQIEIDPSNPEIIYICDPYGRYGLLKSENGGESWTQITDGLTSQASRMVSRLIVTSLNGDTLYISTGLNRYGDPPLIGDGIYKSVNSGQTWAASGLQGYTALTICETGNGSLLAGLEEDGLFSSPEGESWSQVASIPTDCNVWHLESMGNIVVAAVHPYGIFLSSDNGQTFELSYSTYYAADVSIARVSPDVEIYACDFPGFVKYTASSGEWVSVVSPPLPADLMIMGVTAVEDKIYCGAFANSPIFVSEDGAQGWSQLPSAPQSGFYTGLAVDPNDSEKIFAANLGSYMQYMNLPSLSMSSNGGETWSRVGPEAHSFFVHFSPGSSDIMYCGTFRKGAYRSEDGFETWTAIREGDKIVFDIAVDDDNPSVLLLSEWDIEESTIGVYRSENSGQTFEQVLPQACLRLLHIPQSDIFYAATSEGLFESTNQGESWNYKGLSNYNLTSLEWGGGYIFAGAETGEIFRETSSSIDNISGIWNKPVKVSGLLYRNDVLYAGLDGAEVDTTFSMHGGVWRSYDQGENWEDLTGGLQVDNVYGNSSLAFSGSDLLVSTYGGGIQRLSNLLEIESVDPSIISQVIVSPNPSSSGFLFTVNNVQSAPSGITIHDISGRTIRELSASDVNNNSVNFYWDCKDQAGNTVPFGVYLCSVLFPNKEHQNCRIVYVR